MQVFCWSGIAFAKLARDRLRKEVPYLLDSTNFIASVRVRHFSGTKHFCCSHCNNRGTGSRDGGSKKMGNDTVEAFACNANDMKDGEMREVELGESKALLVKNEGKYSAIGHKCTHYGAPLVKGSLKNGVVRCPWHGACFNVKTGDIEDYPGLDCVPKHEIFENNGKIMIRAKVSDLSDFKRLKPMVYTLKKDGPHCLIIGGGPTSVTCAETLRQKGFSGRITIASADSYIPYDR